MEKQFDNEASYVSLEHDKINSTILEQASDTAEKLTTLICKVDDIIECNHTTDNGVTVETYTDEAQDIFNIHYDEQVDELYKLLNRQLKIIE